MFKQHKNLTLLLLLAIFTFSLIGEVSAATLSDYVEGNEMRPETISNNAIYKLKQLGIIEGYPEGSLDLDKSISRAEFAKIAVSMAGMESKADEVMNMDSSFNDVKTEDWFNGFVQVAAAEAYMNGYPSGYFKPNEKIKQEEAVTVLLRILGYNDNLEPDWPSNYICKAAQLGILDDIQFIASKDVTGAELCILCSETLKQYIVQYNVTSNTFEKACKVEANLIENGDNEKELPYTLLQLRSNN